VKLSLSEATGIVVAGFFLVVVFSLILDGPWTR
jgi:hypothetical protein